MEKITKKSLADALRKNYMELIAKALTSNGDEVLVVGSNEYAIPCTDAVGNETFCCITVKMPTGSRDGDAYDGYALAEDYKLKQAEKAEKAEKAKIAKAKKIERDKANREKLAQSKARVKGE